MRQDSRALNWLRHQYDTIETETIWNTIQDDLPPLKTNIQKIIESSKD